MLADVAAITEDFATRQDIAGVRAEEEAFWPSCHVCVHGPNPCPRDDGTGDCWTPKANDVDDEQFGTIAQMHAKNTLY